MRERIGRSGLAVSLGIAGTLLAPATSAAQTTKTVEQIRKVEAPVAPAPAAQRGAAVAPEAPPPPPGFPALAAPANEQDQIAQMTEQFRPYLRVEYHFLRSVGSLTPYQRTRVAREAEREYKDAVVQYVKSRFSPQLRRAGETPRALPDPRKLICEGLARAATRCLDADQETRYHQELALRAEARKQTAIRCLVLSLNQELILSAEQRYQLSERLTSNWDEAWFPSELMLLNVDRYVSRIPSQQILPLLTEEQKKLWELTFQRQAVTGTITGFPSIPVGFPEDEELTEAREARAKDTEGPP
jgi:hypothetical protein